MIELKQVSKTYQLKNNTLNALDHINLTINDGDILGVVGYSGAGKSTLIRLINKLITPTTGQIIIDGIDILTLNKKALNRMRQQIGMIFQDFNLFDQLTVYQNIKLALDISGQTEYHKQKIIDLLELVGLQDKINAYPKQLSGGQKQRVAIARALSNNPKYLLCDEATYALDLKTTDDILNLLKDIQKKTGITIIFITHQIESIKKLCRDVVVMDEGLIVEQNNVIDLFMNPKHAVTKSLVKQSIHLDDTLTNVYELIYQTNADDASTLSEVIKKYNVDMNILHAQVLDIIDQHIGYLYIKITGKDIAHALTYIKSKGIQVNRYDSI
ncbi:ATP-binding cassette domain-containing protein [Mycoplasmatota bacterium]|nr:ATP-binding cassette domain-containing protein [Mycoplasmatota bacterium]